MSHAFETYEQYCIEKQKNVILEEHFLPNGEHYLVCRHKNDCEHPDCKSIKRLEKQMNKLKTFQK